MSRRTARIAYGLASIVAIVSALTAVMLISQDGPRTPEPLLAIGVLAVAADVIRHTADTAFDTEE